MIKTISVVLLSLLVCACAQTQRPKPLWIEGKNASPAKLCGVGFASERDVAEKSAYAAVARIFEADIQSISEDFVAITTENEMAVLNIQTSQIQNEIKTKQILEGVKIEETHHQENTWYALACLNRLEASENLTAKLNALDNEISKLLDIKQQNDKRQQLQWLLKALTKLSERESLHAQLRLISGKNKSSHYSKTEVAQLFNQVMASLRLGVTVEGPYAEEFKAALIKGLAQKHYQVSSDNLDVLIEVHIRMEIGQIENMHYARPIVIMQLHDVKVEKILGSVTEMQKEAHQTLGEAEKRAVRKLTDKLVVQVEKLIQAGLEF